MKPKTEKILEEYAAVVATIKELEKKQEAMRGVIVETFKSDGVEKVESTIGTFSIVKMRRWKYSDKVEAAEEKVKMMKVREQEKGLAEAIESETLRFSTPKVE